MEMQVLAPRPQPGLRPLLLRQNSQGSLMSVDSYRIASPAPSTRELLPERPPLSRPGSARSLRSVGQASVVSTHLPYLERQPSPAPSVNLSDVWVPNAMPDDTPSRSPLPEPVATPQPVYDIVGVEEDRVGRKCMLAYNVFCSLVVVGVISGIFIGIYEWVQHSKRS